MTISEGIFCQKNIHFWWVIRHCATTLVFDVRKAEEFFTFVGPVVSNEFFILFCGSKKIFAEPIIKCYVFCKQGFVNADMNGIFDWDVVLNAGTAGDDYDILSGVDVAKLREGFLVQGGSGQKELHVSVDAILEVTMQKHLECGIGP